MTLGVRLQRASLRYAGSREKERVVHREAEGIPQRIRCQTRGGAPKERRRIAGPEAGVPHSGPQEVDHVGFVARPAHAGRVFAVCKRSVPGQAGRSDRNSLPNERGVGSDAGQPGITCRAGSLDQPARGFVEVRVRSRIGRSASVRLPLRPSRKEAEQKEHGRERRTGSDAGAPVSSGRPSVGPEHHSQPRPQLVTHRPEGVQPLLRTPGCRRGIRQAPVHPVGIPQPYGADLLRAQRDHSVHRTRGPRPFPWSSDPRCRCRSPRGRPPPGGAQSLVLSRPRRIRDARHDHAYSEPLPGEFGP